jgi:hypothetical protein
MNSSPLKGIYLNKKTKWLVRKEPKCREKMEDIQRDSALHCTSSVDKHIDAIQGK